MNAYEIGETITGWDVTMGGDATGVVTRVVWPARYSGTDQPRYRISCADGRERVVESGWVDRNPLTEVMRALQAVGDAVTYDDPAAYQAAVARAREAGCTAEQLADAYTYRAGKRRRAGHDAVSFPPITAEGGPVTRPS